MLNKKVIFIKEEINFEKFGEVFGGLDVLAKKVNSISNSYSEDEWRNPLKKNKEKIIIEIPQIYFRGIPFIFKNEN